MKIKYWLIISYFVVMVLPLIGFYVLYVSLTSLDEQRDLKEHFEMLAVFNRLDAALDDPSLYQYQPEENYQQVTQLADSSMRISLYRSDGLHLFSTLKDATLSGWSNTENLYKNLNELKKNHRTYSMKKAVFSENRIIGIYEVSIVRETWVKSVADRSLLIIVLGGLIFMIVYIAMVILLNRKLNRPLALLMEKMSKFAKGQRVDEPMKYAKDEVGELIKRFMEMKKQIEETSERLKQEQQNKEFIVASLSHDLKTPLTVISTYTEALLDNKSLSASEMMEYRAILFDKLTYMKQMLNDLTTYAAIQSSQMQMEMVLIDGEEFFEMLFSGFEESCAKKEIQLTVDAENEEKYFIDTKQMVRVVDNIVGNAIRHTEQKGSVWLGVVAAKQPLLSWVFFPFVDELNTWRNGGTVIVVQNEGQVIVDEMKDRIFDAFVQADQARAAGGSAGLGLSIAKELIEKHGGKIKLWSAHGYGTLVACWLKEGEIMNEK